MAKNEIFSRAEKLSLPVPAGSLSGNPVLVGSLVGVCETDRDTAGNAAVWMVGGHKLTVNGAVTVIGSPVYIDATGALQVVGTGNTLFGYALALKSAAASIIAVKLAQV